MTLRLSQKAAVFTVPFPQYNNDALRKRYVRYQVRPMLQRLDYVARYQNTAKSKTRKDTKNVQN